MYKLNLLAHCPKLQEVNWNNNHSPAYILSATVDFAVIWGAFFGGLVIWLAH